MVIVSYVICFVLGGSIGFVLAAICAMASDKNQQEEGELKSPVVKRSIVLAGHKTSVSLEDAFWEGLKDIAKARRVTLSDLVGGIDTEREHGNLSSAIRLFVLDHYQKRAASGWVVDNPVRAARYTNVQ
jgi:predicted DNA-binding ribbon-helix-helix protein